MTSDFEKARAHAQLLIRSAREESGGALTSQMIAEQVDFVLSIKPEWKTGVDRDVLIRNLETIFTTWIGEARILQNMEDHKPWLGERKAEIEWHYWNRYKQFLQELGWADRTIEKLENLTDEVLSRLENPLRPGIWDRRGMVVGHVQSGKTANYIGLIAKAADAGYKVLIILAGMHNNLRSQTQMRLDEGFLGYDSIRNLAAGGTVPLIGVGEINPSIQRPDTITTRLENGDFRREVANHFNISPGGHPLLFIVKKNGSVLRNLLEWVEWAANTTDKNGRRLVSGISLLLIDDECDWGSIDTRDIPFDDNGEPDLEHVPTVINQRVRKILYSFDQSAYVGYTATPFANIFIHEKAKTIDHGEDLFPRSFIITLPAPSNYIGPAQVFGLDEEFDPDTGGSPGLPVIRIVDDHAVTNDLHENRGWMPPRHNRTHILSYEGQNTIPPSLREAILAFILTCAARIVRKHENAFNSMLIHVTRFIDVQSQVFDQVRLELSNIQNRVKRGEGNDPFPVIEEMRSIWEKDFIPTTSAINDPDCYPVSWDEIKTHLLRAVSAIDVKLINGSAGDVLDYAEHKGTGLSIIVIGGDKLSRGMTLEGLSVSYFLRASRMYDTLMQMGRWFGYRPGYLDLCRLYTTEDIRDWFRDITVANEELRGEFDRMVAVGGTPRDYGLRVRSHPQLLVTSQVKMRHGIPIELSFSKDISETVVFYRDEDTIKRNYRATVNLIQRIGTGTRKFEKDPSRKRPGGKVHSWKGSLCWTGVSPDVIRQFLIDYCTHPKARKVNCSLLREYIDKQNQNGDLVEWTVLLLGGEGSEHDGFPVGKIRLVKRSWHPDVEPEKRPTMDRFVIRRLVSGRDEAIDINEDEYKRALEKTRKAWTIDRGRSKRQVPPDEPEGVDIRTERPESRGVLLIYPLDPEGKSEKGLDGLPILGFAISFPGNDNDQKVTYIVDNIYYQQEYGPGI
jgi:hypothetical protein